MRSISIAAAVAVFVCSIASGQVINSVLAGNATTNGLNAPIFVCAPPGDVTRLFVVQKDGFIKVRTPANQATTWGTFLNISTLVGTGSEQGLLGMAFHPNYASNGYFYVKYTNTLGTFNIVRRYTVSAGNPDVADATSGLDIISISQPFSNHNAGWIGFGPDGYLYIPTGDGGSANDPNNRAQTLTDMLGKVHRIDVDGGSPYVNPPTNPYFGAAVVGLDSIWHIGVRNPFRCSFDRLTGDFYIGDVGQDAWEEISYQPAGIGGLNFGWRCREGNTCTGLTGCTCTSPTLTNPIHVLSTSTSTNSAIIGGYVYRGCAIPSLRGHYFFGHYNTNQVWSLTHNGTTSTVTARSGDLSPVIGATGGQLVSFGEDGAGELYMCDLSGDEIFKIVPQVPALVGVSNYGTGTPGCNGAHAITLSCTPTILNPGETLTATNAEAGTTMIGIIGALSLPPLSDPLFIAVETLVDLTPGTNFLFQGPVGPNGDTVVAVPIPGLPSLVGLTFFAQEFFAWSSCSPSPLNLSSTPGLSITIQP